MKKPTHEPQPDISVIITTYNRPRQLAIALQALAAQDYPRDRFEVIVVNDGGTPLEDIVRPFEPALQVRLINRNNYGPAAGRNTGLAQARGALIAFTDDDCMPGTGWLSALWSASAAAPDCMLGGRTVNGLPAVLGSAAAHLIVDAVYAFYNREPGNARFFASNNMALPADLLRSMGGFDVEFRLASEDRDLCERWREAGLRMVYVSGAVMTHYHRLTFGEFLRLHFRYGRGAARFHRERVRRGSGVLRDHAGFYRECRGWLQQASGARAVCLAMFLVAWQCANVAGFACEWIFESVPARATGADRAISSDKLR